MRRESSIAYENGPVFAIKTKGGWDVVLCDTARDTAYDCGRHKAGTPESVIRQTVDRIARHSAQALRAYRALPNYKVTQ